MKRNKKSLKFLWALTAIPLVLAGTIAASCSVQSGSQSDSDNQTPGGNQDNNTAQIDWTNIEANQLGRYTLPSTVTPENLISLVKWDDNVKLDQLKVKSIEKFDDNEGTLTAVITYLGEEKTIDIKFFATKSLMFNKEEVQAFEKKLVANALAKKVSPKSVTLDNIGQYIEALAGKDETHSLYHGESSIIITKVEDYNPRLDYVFGTGGIRVYFTLKKGDHTAHWNTKITGFLDNTSEYGV